jgi:hypothetical protein
VNLFVPFVRLRTELVEALAVEGLVANYVDTSGEDGYWKALRDEWAKGETFIVCEQDKIPAPGLLLELWECPESWCATPVPMQGHNRPAAYPSLSCTKFGAELMQAQPNLLEDVGRLNLGFGEKEWSRLDLGIYALLASQFDPHWHEGGRVEHLHVP